MSQQYDDSNSGALFANDKEGNDRRPDYKGKLNVAGKEYRISGWIRTPKSGGKKFMSLKVEPVDDAPPIRQTQARPVMTKPDPEDGEDIPF